MRTMAPMTSSCIPANLTDGLNPEQRQAVEHLQGPLLVVAGPGSGKTRVLTHRIAALITSGTAAAGGVLAVTFTNKAAAEMRERVEGLIGDTAKGMWIATFHSACVRILRTHHALVGLPRSFTIIDPKDTVKVLGDLMSEAGYLTASTSTEERRQKIRAVIASISHAKNHGLTSADLRADYAEGHRMAGAVMDGYNRYLRGAGAVDFDDILLLALHVLRTNPDVAQSYSQRFTHILVDEFQDTNSVQFEIVQRLATHGNVCVVGDADQSIYAFRGALPSVLNAFTRAWPHATTVRLGTNYRSTAAIVEVCAAIIAPNESAVRAPLRTDNAAGAPVRMVALSSDLDEANYVARQIAQRGGSLNQHAVLVRTNAQTRVLETTLRKSNIPHDVVGTVRFYDRAEVKDAMSYLKLASNPQDVFALARAASAPKRGLGASTLARVTDLATSDGLDCVEALEAVGGLGGRGAAGLTQLAHHVRTLQALVETSGPVEALEYILEECGVREYHGRDKRAEATQTRLENLAEVVRGAREFTTQPDGRDEQGRLVVELSPAEQTEAFCEHAALMSAADDTPDTASVQVATIHASKGREWDHVYVVGLEEEILPHKRAQSRDDVAEERRLFYVAASRARKHLTLTRAERRMLYSSVASTMPSRFINDLSASVQHEDRTSPGAANTLHEPTRGFTRPSGFTAPKAQPMTLARPTYVKPQRVPGARLAPEQVSVGMRVNHAHFGEGTITSIAEGDIAVKFANSIRTLNLALAPLTAA